MTKEEVMTPPKGTAEMIQDDSLAYYELTLCQPTQLKLHLLLMPPKEMVEMNQVS